MTPLFHALGLVCALGAVILAASGKRGIRGVCALGVGFAATAAWFNPERLPDASWIGILAALAAALSLTRPGAGYLTSGMAGLLAGFWSVLLRTENLPLAPAVLLAAAVPAITAILAWRRPEFAPRLLQEEGLLMLLVLSVAVAAGPQVVSGWQSAGSLNAAVHNGAQNSTPMWVILLTAGSVGLGGMYSLWRSR